MVFRPDVSDTESTVLADMNSQPIYPNKVDSTNIYIDGTDPVVDTFALSTTCTKTTTTLTFTVSDVANPGMSGVDYVELFVDGGSMGGITTGYVLDMSGFASETSHTVSIKVYDKAGNSSISSFFDVFVDKTAPVIANIKAEQNSVSVLCPDSAVQGVVDIYVDVTDNGCTALVTPPSVSVDGITPVTYIGVAGDTYHYQATVESTTANGSHVITVNASDALGNTSSDSASAICVDKNQVTGTVSFKTLISTGYTFDRVVTLVATDASNVVLKTWTPSLSFTNSASTATASYTLTNVPAGTAHISAKTALHLRQRANVSLDTDGQANQAYVLLGGDLNETNTVNILDYSILKRFWYTGPSGAAGDINGNGVTDLTDYSLMKENWYKIGEAL